MQQRSHMPVVPQIIRAPAVQRNRRRGNKGNFLFTLIDDNVEARTYEFLDNQGTFRLKQPENVSYLYFPIAGAAVGTKVTSFSP